MPPPRHGVSSVNEAVAKQLEAKGIAILVINTAPPSLERGVWVRLQRLAKVLLGLRKLMISADGKTVVYISISGGYGMLYESAAIVISRFRTAQVVVHHHSFRYLDALFWPMMLLARVAGSSTLHVALSPVMMERLQRAYSAVRKVRILSNAGFVPCPARIQNDASAPQIVGFLSNLSASKGLDDYLGLAEACAMQGLPWRFILAGPYESVTDRNHYTKRIKSLPNVDYRGALYAEAKSAFLREIEIFVFPTRYRNEAEPIVVLEALSQGKPVIAFGRGCIEEVLGNCGGKVIPVGSDFVGPALKIMEEWRADCGEFQRWSMQARRRFEELQAESVSAFSKLVTEFNIKTL